MPLSRPVRTLFFLVLFAAGAGALVVFKVPVYKQVAKRYWHEFRRPAVPAMHTGLALVDGSSVPQDPAPFLGASTTGPNLHFRFPKPGFVLQERTSPAIIRVVGDVADSLVSISAGITYTSTDPSPDLRICIRLDHADGSPVAWNEKRLLPIEHHVNEVEHFNFEWLLRDVPVRHEDHVTLFLRNPGGTEVMITGMDVVFRSAEPLRTQANS